MESKKTNTYSIALVESIAILKLLIGTLVSIGIVLVGVYVFRMYASFWRFVVGIPIIMTGFGFIVNNAASLISRIFASAGEIGRRMKDTKLDRTGLDSDDDDN